MNMILSRCGYRCDLCQAYRENIRKKDQTALLSDLWFNIFGFRIPSDKIFCDGCLSPNEQNPNLIDRECPVRPCVLEKGINNCAYCASFICSRLEQRIVDLDQLQHKLQRKITQNEYDIAIKPYENQKRLLDLQNQLKMEDKKSVVP